MLAFACIAAAGLARAVFLGFVTGISKHRVAARNPPDRVSLMTRVAVSVAIVDGARAGAITAAGVAPDPSLGTMTSAGGECVAHVLASRKEEESDERKAHSCERKRWFGLVWFGGGGGGEQLRLYLPQ